MSHVETVTSQAAKHPLFAGIDVGGTSIKLGVVDDLGRSLGKSSVPTHEERGPTEAMERTIQELTRLLQTINLKIDDLSGIGIGSPGPQDIPSGVIIAPDNLP